MEPPADAAFQPPPRRAVAVLRFGALLVLVGLVLAALTATGGWAYLTPKGVNGLAAHWGAGAVPAFIVVYSIASFAFVPRGLLALAAGAAFGMPSALYTYAGALVGETLAFYAARLLGRGFVQMLLGTKLQGWEQRFGGSGFVAIVLLRLVPVVPCDVINYGAGLGSVRYRDFLAATALGIIPGCLLFAAAGHGLVEWNPIPLVFGFGGLVVLGVLPLWWRHTRAADRTAGPAAGPAAAETILDSAD